MNQPTEVARELDAIHDRAKAAYLRRDLAAYRELFAPGLSYRQADGRVIDRDRLIRDVADQFRRVDRVRSSFVRESIESSGDSATEVLVQSGSAGTTAFLVLHRTWELTRRGRYTWRKLEQGWRIEAVEVLEEHTSPGRFSIGFLPPDGPSPRPT